MGIEGLLLENRVALHAEDLPQFRNLPLTMYAIKHLRANAILEATHENNTYTEEELRHHR